MFSCRPSLSLFFALSLLIVLCLRAVELVEIVVVLLFCLYSCCFFTVMIFLSLGFVVRISILAS